MLTLSAVRMIEFCQEIHQKKTKQNKTKQNKTKQTSKGTQLNKTTHIQTHKIWSHHVLCYYHISLVLCKWLWPHYL